MAVLAVAGGFAQIAAGKGFARALMVGVVVSATTGVLYAIYNVISIN